jgi:hypothetical protein
VSPLVTLFVWLPCVEGTRSLEILFSGDVNLTLGFAFACWYAIGSAVDASQRVYPLNVERNEFGAVQLGSTGLRCLVPPSSLPNSSGSGRSLIGASRERASGGSGGLPRQ